MLRGRSVDEFSVSNSPRWMGLNERNKSRACCSIPKKSFSIPHRWLFLQLFNWRFVLRFFFCGRVRDTFFVQIEVSRLWSIAFVHCTHNCRSPTSSNTSRRETMQRGNLKTFFQQSRSTWRICKSLEKSDECEAQFEYFRFINKDSRSVLLFFGVYLGRASESHLPSTQFVSVYSRSVALRPLLWHKTRKAHIWKFSTSVSFSVSIERLQVLPSCSLSEHTSGRMEGGKKRTRNDLHTICFRRS